LIRSVTTLGRGAGDGVSPVFFDFRIGSGLALETYNLVEYFSNPAAGSTFAVSDLAFTANIPDFDGFFDLVVFSDGTRGLTFTVTAIPEPSSFTIVVAVALMSSRRRRRRV
jgi:hypothetical protein